MENYIMELINSNPELLLKQHEFILSKCSLMELKSIIANKTIYLFLKQNDILFSCLYCLKEYDCKKILKDIFIKDKENFFNHLNDVLVLANSFVIKDEKKSFLKLIGYTEDQWFELLEKNNIEISGNVYVNYLVEDSNNNFDILKKYMKYILRNTQFIFDAKKNIYGTKDKNLKKVYNDIIDGNPSIIINSMINNSLKINSKEENVNDFISILIEELLKEEKKQYHDIKLKGTGAFSFVYLIGNKVLKIGKQRDTFKIPNHRRFLQPLYRDEIRKLDDSGVLLCVEITERVSTTNIKEKDMYIVYKDLRDSGLIWLDVKSKNVGKLLKDNRIYHSTIDYVDKASTGYLTDNNEILKKGEPVLIDVDYVYDYDKFIKKGGERIINQFYLLKKFEEKYQREILLKKGLKK